MGIKEDKLKLLTLSKEIQEVQKRITEWDSLSPTQKLSEILHIKLCRSNQCDWGYSSWYSGCDMTICRPLYLSLASQLITAGLDPNKFPNS